MTSAQCPVCGYPDLVEPPWTDESASFEICPSCGTQFGYDDAAGGEASRRPHIYTVLRERWVRAGMPWRSRQAMPEGWDPMAHLRSIGAVE